MEHVGFVVALEPFQLNHYPKVTIEVDGKQSIFKIKTKTVYGQLVRKILTKYNSCLPNFFELTALKQLIEIDKVLKGPEKRRFHFKTIRGVLTEVMSENWKEVTTDDIVNKFKNSNVGISFTKRGDELLKRFKEEDKFSPYISIRKGNFLVSTKLFIGGAIEGYDVIFERTQLTVNMSLPTFTKRFWHNNPDMDLVGEFTKLQKKLNRCRKMVSTSKLIRISPSQVSDIVSKYESLNLISPTIGNRICSRYEWAFHHGNDRLYNFILILSYFGEFGPKTRRGNLRRMAGELIMLVEIWGNFIRKVNDGEV